MQFAVVSDVRNDGLLPFVLCMLGVSLVMLIWVNVIVHKNGGPTISAFVVCFCLSGLPLCVVMYYKVLLFQGLLLALTLPLSLSPRRGPMIYTITSIIITLLLWLNVFISFMHTDLEYRIWREMVPFESMEQRVPVPQADSNSDKYAASLVTQSVEDSIRIYNWRGRSGGLNAVHKSRVKMFHEAAGFGMARMIRFDSDPKEEYFQPDLTPPIPQPEHYDPNAVSLGEDVPDKLKDPFSQLHANGISDFVYPDGFGYIKSRNEVSGFRSHRFSQIPEPVEKWEVRRVELIGLLLNPTPKVYVTENLPRMADVSKVPTRDPDSFESDGLRAIRDGNDIYSRGDNHAARMIGAIRSVKQCVECHGGKRGDLLGAFTYRLRRNMN